MVKTVNIQVTKTIKPNENLGYVKDNKLKIEINAKENSKKYILPIYILKKDLFLRINKLIKTRMLKRKKDEFSVICGRKNDTEIRYRG